MGPGTLLTPRAAQDRPTAQNDPAQNVGGAEAEKPRPGPAASAWPLPRWSIPLGTFFPPCSDFRGRERKGERGKNVGLLFH